MAVLKRNISFIAAAKSCKRTFVGPVIRGTGAIPVERPQDIAYKGAGRIIQIKDQIISGRDTKFTTLGVGALL
jgi:glycerol-3-phosphate O-acyltransferase/dihydroxyacetone phosphate acyltransferase